MFAGKERHQAEGKEYAKAQRHDRSRAAMDMSTKPRSWSLQRREGGQERSENEDFLVAAGRVPHKTAVAYMTFFN